MRNTIVVAWKEFRTFFQTPIGYVILFVFTLLGGWFFFSVGAGQPFFIQKESTLRGLLTWLPWLFLVFAPAITMRLWAEERRTGTIETLLTLPLTDWQIVLGKFLAAFGLVAVWLLCLTPIAGVVAWFGEPDPGPILGGFIGALLLGGAYAAIGVAASSLTENQIISMVVGVASAFFFLLVGFDPVVGLFPDWIGGFLYNLSLSTHFHSISRGVLDSRDLLYYATFIAFFLAVNVWAVRRQPGRGATIAILGAILVLVNYLCAGHFFRIDLTENGRYTLAADTKRILRNLDDDLRLTAYLSSDVPVEFTNRRRDIEDLVREFESYAGGHLRVEIVDPARGEAERKATQDAGIPEMQFNVSGADKLEIKAAYLGMVVEFGEKTEKLRTVPGVETLEYDLVRRIAKLTRRAPVKVAWQVNDPFGGMNIPGMNRPPSSDRHTPGTDLREIDEALKQEYDTTTVDLKSKVPDEVRALVLCNGETLNDVQKFHLDQYLMRGGGLVVMADGTQPMSFGGMGRGNSPFMRTASDKLPEDLFSHYGFKIHKNVILDRVCLPVPMRLPGMPFEVAVNYPAAVVAISDFIDQDHPISARFRDLAFLWPSSIELDPKPGVTKFELVRTSDHAKALDGFIDVSFQRLQDESSDTFDPATFNSQFLLAGMLEGNFQSYFVTRAVPQEVIDGGSGAAASDPHSSPFGDLIDPFDDGTAHAKEIDPETSDPPDEPGTDGGERAPEGGGKGEGPAGDGAPSDDGDPGPPEGGPSVRSPDDVPGGGIARGQEGSPLPDAPAAAPADAAPAMEFEYLKQSTAPGKIFVFGTSEFAVDDLVRGQLRNGLFLQSIVDYMASESLSTLRVKRLDAGLFDEPSSAAKFMARALGWFAAPLILLGLGVFVYVWRRSIRPARARRRMAISAAN